MNSDSELKETLHIAVTNAVLRIEVTPVIAFCHSGAVAPEFTCKSLPAVPMPNLDKTVVEEA